MLAFVFDQRRFEISLFCGLGFVRGQIATELANLFQQRSRFGRDVRIDKEFARRGLSDWLLHASDVLDLVASFRIPCTSGPGHHIAWQVL